MDKTSEVVHRQIVAMGANLYEVGLFKPEAEREPCGTVMIPRMWDAESLMRSIPWMRLQNLQGRNIYVRPKGEHNLSMVNDLNRESVSRMFASGFKPAVVVETSPGNYQAWLKHPKALSKKVSTAAARKLAEEFGGDKGAADWRHYGRLAGFTNRKEKYQQTDGLFPFVRLLSASGATYAHANRFIAEIEATLEKERHRAQQNRTRHSHRATAAGRTIEQFRANPLYGGDGTRIDLAYAIYALSHGMSQEQVEAAIRTRDLSHKGSEKRQAEYVERTLKKALALVERKESVLTR